MKKLTSYLFFGFIGLCICILWNFTTYLSVGAVETNTNGDTLSGTVLTSATGEPVKTYTGGTIGINDLNQGWKIFNTQYIMLSVWTDCRNVRSTNGYSIFIPTRTRIEWEAFKTGSPQVGAIVTDCITTPASSFSNLVFTHTSGMDRFTLGWSGGTSNGTCKVQMQNPGTSTWVETDGVSYNCDADLAPTQIVIANRDTMFGASWSNVSLRILRISDNYVFPTFSSSLTCSSVPGILTTDNIDQDCNGIWNDSRTTMESTPGCGSGTTCAQPAYGQNIYTDSACTTLHPIVGTHLMGYGARCMTSPTLNVYVDCTGGAYCCGGPYGMTTITYGSLWGRKAVTLPATGCTHNANITRYY